MTIDVDSEIAQDADTENKMILIKVCVLLIRTAVQKVCLANPENKKVFLRKLFHAKVTYLPESFYL